MTAAMSLDRHRHDRAEQVEHLRRKMAAISGKVGPGRRGDVPSNDVLPESESLLPLPESLTELAADHIATGNGGGAVGCPVTAA